VSYVGGVGVVVAICVVVVVVVCVCVYVYVCVRVCVCVCVCVCVFFFVFLCFFFFAVVVVVVVCVGADIANVVSCVAISIAVDMHGDSVVGVCVILAIRICVLADVVACVVVAVIVAVDVDVGVGTSCITSVVCVDGVFVVRVDFDMLVHVVIGVISGAECVSFAMLSILLALVLVLLRYAGIPDLYDYDVTATVIVAGVYVYDPAGVVVSVGVCVVGFVVCTTVFFGVVW